MTTTRHRRRATEDDQQERPDISLEPKTKVWVEHGGLFVMGDGGLCLLQALKARGSLTLAARDVGWSYRHAWEYIRRAERVLGAALTGSVPGKGTNRGTALTSYGVNVLETLAALRGRVDSAVSKTRPNARGDRISRARRPTERHRYNSRPSTSSDRRSHCPSSALIVRSLGDRPHVRGRHYHVRPEVTL